jgi:anti-anti-sigma factor
MLCALEVTDGGGRMEFKVSTEALEGTGILVASVEGDIDLSNGRPLAKAAGAAIDARSSLLLDLSQCSVIDSIGLRSLLHAGRLLDEIGEAMAIVSDPESPVRRMLSVSGVDVDVAIVATPEEALAVLARERVRDQAPVSLAASTNGGPPTDSPASP